MNVTLLCRKGFRITKAKPSILNSGISLSSDGCALIRLMEIFKQISKFFSLKENNVCWFTQFYIRYLFGFLVEKIGRET